MTRRASTAERTLRTQIAHFESRQANILHEIDLLNAQVTAYNNAIYDLNTELTRVQSLKETKS